MRDDCSKNHIRLSSVIDNNSIRWGSPFKNKRVRSSLHRLKISDESLILLDEIINLISIVLSTSVYRSTSTNNRVTLISGKDQS